MLHITSIKFINYKSFSEFSISLNGFNILVGPNNAGKSTVIGSLKLLNEGIRKARHKNPQLIKGPDGLEIYGHEIDLGQVPISTENVFHNYNDDSPAIIKFRLSDGSFLRIFFPEKGICYMNHESDKVIIRSTKDFKKHVNMEIGFVPILGPVDHHERLFQKEAARQALMTYTASRNFRNIWHHYPDSFNEFKAMVKTTWPGMDINFPEVDRSVSPAIINMFCPEDRMDREIFWSGFGFQVWCQMLTFIIKNKDATIFLIDEPDIYLHSDLQRQLLGILKNLGPDILIATHSTEMISEAEPTDILVIQKSTLKAKRLKDAAQLRDIFQVLGSNLNPTLTQIAKSCRVLFVEGKDFTFFSKMAKRLNFVAVSNRADFAVIPVQGFNPVRLRAFKEGIEKTIGSKILSAVIFDKDYRSEDEVNEELAELRKGNVFAHIHSRKEVENFLLIPTAIESAIRLRMKEANNRTGRDMSFDLEILDLLTKLSNNFKTKTQAQLQSQRLKQTRRKTGIDDSVIIEKLLIEFEQQWSKLDLRLQMLPGKEFLSSLNQYLSETFGITITDSNIIECIAPDKYPEEIKIILKQISDFRKEPVT